MILSLSRTLPNGHRDVTDLTKTHAGPVLAKAVPGAKLAILVNGQPLAGKELINGKTPQLKKLGQDLLIEIDGETVAQIEDFYAMPGATLDGSYWTYAELAALSPAASLPADIAPVAASEASSGLSAVWWTALGVSGAGAIASAASGSSSGSSSSGKPQSEQAVDKTLALTTVSGTVMAGPLLPGHGLFVTLHRPDGSVLAGPVRVGDDSTFTLPIPASYKGPILARVVDSNNAPDFLDEASTQPIDLSHSLRAALVSSGESDLQIVVTPLTELVVRKLGLAPNLPNTEGTSSSELSDITAEQILRSNADMAERFGLKNGLFEQPSLVIDTQGKPTAAANFAGHILAALSGLQDLHGAELGMEYPLAASELEDPAQLQALLIVGAKMAAPADDADPLGSFVAAASNSPLGQALTTAVEGARNMTDAELDAFDRRTVAKIPLPVLAAMTPEQLGKLSKDAVAAFDHLQLRVLGDKELNLLANQGKLSKEQLSSLSDTQLASLFAPDALDPVINKNAFAADGTIKPDALGPDQPPLLSGTLPTPLPSGAKLAIYDGLTYLGDAVVGTDGKSWTFMPDSLPEAPHDFSAHVELGAGKSIASASFDHDKAIDAASALTDKDLAEFDRHTIANLPRPVLAELTPEQLAKLSKDAVAGLSPHQLQALDLSQLAALAKDGKLNAEQLSTLSDSQLAALFPPATLDPVVNDKALADDGTLNPDPNRPPLLSGTLPAPLPAGAKVAIYDGLNYLGDAVVGANGKSWTFEPDSLPKGPHDFSAHLEFGAGTSVASASFDHDKAIDAARALTDDALAALDRHTVAAIPRPVLAELTPEQLGKLSKDAVAGLSPHQLQALDLSQLAALAKDGKLNAEQLSTLSDSQLAALFPPAQLDPVVNNNALAKDGTLDPDAIGPGKPPLLSGTLPAPLPPGAKVAIYDGLKHLGDAVVGADGKTWTFTPDSLAPGTHDFSAHVELGGGKSIASSSFDHDKAVEAAHALNDDALAKLDRNSIATLPRPVLAELTPEQLSKLSKDAVAGLSPDQLQALDLSQLAALAKDGKLNAEQLGTLSDTQLAALFPPAQLDPVVNNNALAKDGTLDPDAIGPGKPPLLSGILPAPLPPGAKVAIYDGLIRLGDAVIAADGKSWTFAPDSLAPGTHNFSAHVELGGGKSIASASFDRDQANELARQMTDQQLSALDRDSIASLPLPVLAALTPEQLDKLSAAAIPGLTPDQLQALDNAQLIQLAQKGKLSAEQAAALSDSQLAALFPTATLVPAATSDLNGTSAAILPNTSSKDNTPTLSGTLAVQLPAGAKLGIFDGDTRLGDAVVQADGKQWTYTPNALDNGLRTISTRVELAGGKSISSDVFTLDVITPHPTVSFDGPIATNDTINAAAKAAGVRISGTTHDVEDGGTVTLQWGDKRLEANVTDNRWSTIVVADDVPAEANNSIITATAREPSGFLSPAVTRDVRIKTTIPTVTMAATIADDNMVNASEKAAGVTISGTSANIEDGQALSVSWGSTTKTATVNSNAWSVIFTTDEVPADSQASSIEVNAEDSAGNPAAMVSRSVAIVSELPTITITPLAGAGIINAQAKRDGVTVEGTTTGLTDGQLVTLSFGDHNATATVHNERWTHTFTSDNIPADGLDIALTASVSDRAQNTASTSITVGVDTDVPTITIATPVSADDLINAADKAASVTISGSTTGVENEQPVTVNWGGSAKTTTVTDNAWSITFFSAEIPADATTVDLSATVSDIAGNSAESTPHPVKIDSLAPAVSSSVRAGASVSNGGFESDAFINRQELGGSVSFTVTFSEAVTGVGVANFNVTDSTGAALSGATPVIAVVENSPSSYTVQVNDIATLASSTLRLNVNNDNNTILDLAQNPFSGSFTTGEAYTVDSTAPQITSIQRGTTEGVNPISHLTALDSIDFLVTFSEEIAPDSLDGADFAVTLDGSTFANGVEIATPVLVNGNQYRVTVSGTAIADAHGELALVLAADAAVHDIANNSLSTILPAMDADNQKYLMDNTPALAVMSRSRPGGDVIVAATQAGIPYSLDDVTPRSGARVTKEGTIRSINMAINLDDTALAPGGEILTIGGTNINLNGNNLPASVSVNGTVWDIAYANHVLTLTTAEEAGVRNTLAQAVLRNASYMLVTEMTSGNRTMDITVTDAAGNVSLPSRVVFSSDTTPPVVDLNALPDSQNCSSQVTLEQAKNGVLLQPASDAVTVTEDRQIAEIRVAIQGLINGDAEKFCIGDTELNLDGTALPASVSDGTSTWRVTFSASTDKAPASFTFALANASNAQAQTLLRSMQYKNTATNNLDGIRTFAIAAVDDTGNITREPAVAAVIIASSAPDKAGVDPLVTLDADQNGVLGDSFYLNFSEQVDSSKITLANLQLPQNISLGHGASVTAVNPVMLDGVAYASKYLVTSGANRSYTTGTPLRFAAASVIDGSGKTAASDVVFTMTDIVAPTAPLPPAAISGNNYVNLAEKNAGIPVTFTHDAAQAGDILKVYVDGSWRRDVTITRNATSTTVTLLSTDWNPDGLQAITARVQDAAGNLSASSIPKPVTLDTELVNGFETISMTRDQGVVGKAEQGDVITVVFHERVKLAADGLDATLFGANAQVSPVVAVNGYSDTWNITLGRNPNTDLASKPVTFTKVTDLAGNQASITGSIPEDLFSVPTHVYIQNVKRENVLSSAESDATQTILINVGKMAVGDRIALLMDGNEVSSHTATTTDVQQGFVSIDLATNVWGGDGTRTLTATAQRGTGSIVESTVRSVYVALDQPHWASQDVLWFDPDTLSDTASIATWRANTRGTTFSNGFTGDYFAQATRNDQFAPLPGYRNGHVMLNQRDLNSQDGFNLPAHSAIIGGQYQGSISLGVTAIYGNASIGQDVWPIISAIGDRIDARDKFGNRILLTGDAPNLIQVGQLKLQNGMSASMPSTYVMQFNDLTASTGTGDTKAYARMTAYLNGLDSGSTDYAGTDVNAQTYNSRIGTIGYFDRSWNGQIGDVAFFLRTTTHNEMQEFSVYQSVKYAMQGTAVAVKSVGAIYDLTTSANSASLLDDVLDLSIDRRGVGNDTITVAGADYVNAGSGNDTIKIRDFSFRLLDGGLGYDTLMLDTEYAGPSNIVLADYVSNARGNSTAANTNDINATRDSLISRWDRSTVTAPVADVTLAPDNTMTADMLTLSNTENVRDFRKVFTGLGSQQTYTFSVWVKLGTATDFNVGVNNGNNVGTIAGDKLFTADDGLSTTDWQRVSITFTTDAAGKALITLGATPANDRSGVQQSAGTVYVWGAKLTAGNSAPPETIEQLIADERVNQAGFHKLQGFEHIDLANSIDAQTLMVSTADVNQLSETNTLWVSLGNNDALQLKDFNAYSLGYWTDVHGNVFDRKWTGIENNKAVEVYSRGGQQAATWQSQVLSDTSIQLILDQTAVGSTNATEWTISQGAVTNAALNGNVVTLTLDNAPTSAFHLSYTGTGISNDQGQVPRYKTIWVGTETSNILDGSANASDQAFLAHSSNSTITGGKGADLLVAGGNSSTLTGGDGADTFRWGMGLTGTSTVTDFVKTQGDRIDLSGILAESELALDGVEGFLELTKSGNDAVLKIDVDGGSGFNAPTQTIIFTNGWTDDGGLNVGLDALLQQQIIKA